MTKTEALVRLATVILKNVNVQMTQAMELVKACGGMEATIATMKKDGSSVDSLVTLIQIQAELQHISKELMQNAMNTYTQFLYVFANCTSRAEIEWR